MTTIKAGDEVRVFDGGMIFKGEVEHPGRVVKVGRTLVTIAWADREEKFRLLDRRIHNYEGEQRFEPCDQGAVMTTINPADEAGDFWSGVLAAGNEIRQHRRAAAITVLREHGIELTNLAPGHCLTLEQIEALAEVASTFTKQEG